MRFPLTLIKKEADRAAASRECGECTACCVLPRIGSDEPSFPEGKLGYTPCKHLCTNGGGCSIYEQRPQLCQDYSCLWRVGIVDGDERRRPDNLGLMFTLDQDERDNIVVEAWELWDGAASDHPGRYVIESIALKMRVSIRFYGVPASINFDLPDVFQLGRDLSRASQDDPKALAIWYDKMVMFGRLLREDQVSVINDLEELHKGNPVKRHYKRK